MAATSDFFAHDTSQNLAISGHPLSRILFGFAGVVLMAAAAGLWIVPGSSFDPSLALIKLGLSLFLALGGAALLQSARRTIHPEVLLDPSQGQMRVVERDESGQIHRDTTTSYEDLSEVDFRDGMLIARDHHGQAVVEIPLDRTGDFDEIRAALGPTFARAA